jgi:mRNA interferase RelE/StbE
MTWKIVFTDSAEKSFSKLKRYSQQLIQKYLNAKILKLEHPKLLGKALSHEMKGLWRYRVDKFRIICEIQDHELTILVIKIAHRRVVYD